MSDKIPEITKDELFREAQKGVASGKLYKVKNVMLITTQGDTNINGVILVMNCGVKDFGTVLQWVAVEFFYNGNAYRTFSPQPRV